MRARASSSELKIAYTSLVVSLSNHEQNRSSLDRPVLSETLILRQAQDERESKALEEQEHAGSDQRLAGCGAGDAAA